MNSLENTNFPKFLSGQEVKNNLSNGGTGKNTKTYFGKKEFKLPRIFLLLSMPLFPSNNNSQPFIFLFYFFVVLRYDKKQTKYKKKQYQRKTLAVKAVTQDQAAVINTHPCAIAFPPGITVKCISRIYNTYIVRTPYQHFQTQVNEYTHETSLVRVSSNP